MAAKFSARSANSALSGGGGFGVDDLGLGARHKAEEIKKVAPFAQQTAAADFGVAHPGVRRDEPGVDPVEHHARGEQGGDSPVPRNWWNSHCAERLNGRLKPTASRLEGGRVAPAKRA